MESYYLDLRPTKGNPCLQATLVPVVQPEEHKVKDLRAISSQAECFPWGHLVFRFDLLPLRWESAL